MEIASPLGGRSPKEVHSPAEITDFIFHDPHNSATADHPCRRDEAEFRSQEQEKFALFGPALTSVATTRPSGAPLKRPGLHSPNSEDSLTACTPRNTTRDSLDFPKIRATRASNTAKVTIADLFLAV
ncbi:unnamed protein product [Pleuronectes platessa]|uniref:Uncharacterized protein n=1 Tax=Pleuronectes platessa TaxID=8262 RepID=A0A9N7U3K6_PLEPL|nr:unnamed protein product [Pleuronectes platessa]